MKNELKVYPCARGKLCSAVYDDKDRTVVIFDSFNVALGYIQCNEIPEKCWKCIDLFKEETK